MQAGTNSQSCLQKKTCGPASGRFGTLYWAIREAESNGIVGYTDNSVRLQIVGALQPPVHAM